MKNKKIPWTEITEKANLSEGLISGWKKYKDGPNFDHAISVLDFLGVNLYVDTSPEDLLKNYSVSTR